MKLLVLDAEKLNDDHWKVERKFYMDMNSKNGSGSRMNSTQ